MPKYGGRVVVDGVVPPGGGVCETARLSTSRIANATRGHRHTVYRERAENSPEKLQPLAVNVDVPIVVRALQVRLPKNRLTDPIEDNMRTKTPLQRIQIGALSLVCVLTLSVAGFHYLGNYDWLDAVWMVVITVSTVGFSEHTESTTVVQLLTIGVILLGVTSAVYTCGGFIQLMLEGEVERALGKRKMTKEIQRLNGHVIICGFGRLGLDLVNQLQHRGIPFVVVDIDPDTVRQAGERKILAIQGDATSEQVLQTANLSEARALVTALPSDAENVFITLTARNLRPDIQIIAKSEQESSCRKLRQAGADKIVMPHRVGAQQMERMISRPTTADLVELFAEASHLEMELDEFRISRKSDLVGTALSDSNIKEKFNLLVVGIKNREGEFRFNPPPHETIGDDDTLLVIGQVDDINRMKVAHQT